MTNGVCACGRGGGGGGFLHAGLHWTTCLMYFYRHPYCVQPFSGNSPGMTGGSLCKEVESATSINYLGHVTLPKHLDPVKDSLHTDHN